SSITNDSSSSASGTHRYLHSFPTRRSSDLSCSRRRRWAPQSPAGSTLPPPARRRVRPPAGSTIPPAGRWSGHGGARAAHAARGRSEEHTSELQSHLNLVCRLLLEKKNTPHT